MDSIKGKLTEGCSQISSKHTFKKLAGFQKPEDGCPARNSVKRTEDLYIVGAIWFSIPSHSLDFNPMENIFNYVKSEQLTIEL